jgi:hypothetical protein
MMSLLVCSTRRQSILPSLKCAKRVSFTVLTEYLARLEELRAEAVAATLTIPDGAGSGGGKRQEREDAGEMEKKKKVKVSQGVKALEKVNTRGMKDMRSFFVKKPVKASS